MSDELEVAFQAGFNKEAEAAILPVERKNPSGPGSAAGGLLGGLTGFGLGRLGKFSPVGSVLSTAGGSLLGGGLGGILLGDTDRAILAAQNPDKLKPIARKAFKQGYNPGGKLRYYTGDKSLPDILADSDFQGEIKGVDVNDE